MHHRSSNPSTHSIVILRSSASVFWSMSLVLQRNAAAAGLLSSSWCCLVFSRVRDRESYCRQETLTNSANCISHDLPSHTNTISSLLQRRTFSSTVLYDATHLPRETHLQDLLSCKFFFISFFCFSESAHRPLTPEICQRPVTERGTSVAS